jgi:hypothetical protein
MRKGPLLAISTPAEHKETGTHFAYSTARQHEKSLSWVFRAVFELRHPVGTAYSAWLRMPFFSIVAALAATSPMSGEGSAEQGCLLTSG